MPRIPAACLECGALYPSPLRARRPDVDTAFEVPVPCPECGSGGRAPAEVLARLASLVAALRELSPEEERLDTFLSGAKEAIEEAEDREEAVLDTLRVDPGLGRLAGTIPGESPTVMAAFLPLVARLAAAVRAGGDGSPGEAGTPEPAELVERVLEELYEERAGIREEAGEPEEVLRARSRLGEAGRNDPCPCGSGDKYKDCHWMEDLRVTRE